MIVSHRSIGAVGVVSAGRGGCVCPGASGEEGEEGEEGGQARGHAPEQQQVATTVGGVAKAGHREQQVTSTEC